MYCNKCGAFNVAGEKLCLKCGAELSQEIPIIDKSTQYEVESVIRQDTVDVSSADEVNNSEAGSEKTKSDSSVDEWFAEINEDEASQEIEESEEAEEVAHESEQNKIKVGEVFKRHWKFAGACILVVLVILAAIFYKPVFYNTTFTTAKIVNNINKDFAISLAEVAYGFQNTDDCKNFIDRTSLEKAHDLINTDISEAIDIANKAYKATQSDSLKSFIDNSNILKEYSKTYGAPYVGNIANEKITVTEYKIMLNNTKSQIESNANLTDPTAKAQFWAGQIQGKKAEDFLREQTIIGLHQFKIQYIKAREYGTVLDEKESATTISGLEDQIKTQFGTGTAADTAFKTQVGVIFPQFKAFYRDIMLISKFEKDTLAKYKATDTELKQFYDKNKDNLDSVTVTHILLFTINPTTGKALSAEAQADAKTKADSVLAQAKAGSDITALAKKYSQDTALSQNNGDYTFKNSDQFTAEFKKWAFEAKIGDAGIVKASYGYHVMKLIKRTGFADITKADLSNAYAANKEKTLFDGWEKDKKFDVKKDQKIIDSIKVE